MQEKLTFSGKSTRLDKFLAKNFPIYSRSHWSKLIESKSVLVNNQSISKKYLLKNSDEIVISIEESKVKPIDIPVLHEDSKFIVLNKPAGVLSVSKKNRETEYTAEDFIKSISPSAQLVHRIDRGTSGVLVGAKSQKIKNSVQTLLAGREVNKIYLALAEGITEDKFQVDIPIKRSNSNPAKFTTNPSGKLARTDFKKLKNLDDSSLLQIFPKTGRTNQIRVHLSHIGHPIVGDKLYGSMSSLENNRFLLHSMLFGFELGGKKYNFVAPPSDDMSELMQGVNIDY